MRVSEGWAKPFIIGGDSNSFGIAIGSDELERKAIKVMKIARSALLYVAFAIGNEERRRMLAVPKESLFSMPLFGLDVKRRRRAPL